jgi:hypothetical protein
MSYMESGVEPENKHVIKTKSIYLCKCVSLNLSNQAHFLGHIHKVRTYKEYHSACPSSELGLSQPLSRQRVFPSPQKQGGGGTLARGWGVGGSPNSDEGHTLWYS